MIIQGLQIRIINQKTGEQLQKLELNPSGGSQCSDVLTHHKVPGGGVLVQDIGTSCVKT